MLVNGILSGAEIAIIAVRQTRLRALVDEGNAAARAVQALREQPERFLATVQIGITVVSAAAGAFGGATFARDLEPLVRRLPLIAAYAEELSLVAVVVLVSYLSLVLGELVPKSLALKAPERYSLVLGRPLSWLATAARPFVWFLTASSNVVLRAFGDRTSFTEARLSSEELQQMVREAAKAGTVHPRAGEIASRALEFPELTAADVMVPRNQVVALSKSAPRQDLRSVLLENNYSRYPVYEGTADHIVGYIATKDVLTVAWEEPLFVLQDLIRPAYFVAESTKAVDVLSEMRQRHTPFAVVVDERGGMAGIVTMEDLLEELVGDIFSEHIKQEPELFHREPDGSITAAGTAPVRDLNRELGLQLPEQGDWSTIAGLCLALAGRIPAPGERLSTRDGHVLEILDASARRVRLVRIRAPARAPQQG